MTTTKTLLAMRLRIRALRTTTRTKNVPPRKGGGAPIGAPSMSAFRRSNVAIRSLRGSGSVASRSPFGAPPWHSPGRTNPPLAQLQFPRFLRPDLTGVTRFDLSRVYRAPRRPVVVPAERWPGAARERMANPPAFAYLVQELGQELNVRIAVEAGCHRPRFAFQACLSGKAPSMSEVDEYVTEMGTIVKHNVSNRETQRNCPPWAEWRRRQPWRRLHRYPLCGGAV